MRLRLSVQRDGLPQANIVWSFPDDPAHAATTIAELLNEVNLIIPLEAENWGLEDYVVQLGTFECLHFSKLSDVLKDEDHLHIRPLHTADVRARTLSGRLQIDHGGRHLIDGVPFGRPLLRLPDRPAIHIPEPEQDPESANALAIGENDSQDQPTRQTTNLLRLGERGEDDEDDEDFEPSSRARKRRRRDTSTADRSERSVHFEDENRTGLGALIALPSDDDESEEEFQPSEEDVSSDSDGSSSSEGSSDSDSSSGSEESSGSGGSGDSDAEMEDRASSPESRGLSTTEDSSSDSSPELASSKEKQPTTQPATNMEADEQNKSTLSTRPRQSLPGEGKSRTRARNTRRREARKLIRLKAWGILPQSAGHQALQAYMAGSHVESLEESRVTSHIPSFDDDLEQARQRLLAAIEGGGVEIAPECPDGFKGVNQPEQVETRATMVQEASQPAEGQEMDEAGEPAAVTEEQEMGEAERSAGEPAGEPTGESAAEASEGLESGEVNESPPEQSAPKRARLDVSGTRRMLFGSLGLRNPKTKEDEEKLRQRLAEKAKRGKKTPAVQAEEEAKQEESPPDPDLWKTKVKLMAFECCDEGVTLSAPPFPFQQRWDPQQQFPPRKKGKKNKKRKLQQQQEEEYNEEDYYDESYYDESYYDESYYDESQFENAGEEEWAQLDYNDPVEAAAEDGNDAAADNDNDAAESQLLQDAGTTEVPRSQSPEDLPPLPADLSALPLIDVSTLDEGAAIVFRRLEVSAATGWTPQMSETQSARLEERYDDGVVRLRLAKRDCPQKEVVYDDKGRRVYDKFEMDTGEEEDEGVLEVEVSELFEPRLLEEAPEGGKVVAGERDGEGGAVIGESHGTTAEGEDGMTVIANAALKREDELMEDADAAPEGEGEGAGEIRCRRSYVPLCPPRVYAGEIGKWHRC